MKGFRRELFIDMVIHRGIFKNNQKYALPVIYLQTYNKGQFLLETVSGYRQGYVRCSMTIHIRLAPKGVNLEAGS